MSLETIAGKATIVQACAVFHISRQAYYKARRPVPPPPARPPRPSAKPPEWTPAEALRPAIRKLVERFPAWGVRKIHVLLQREGLRASRKRVWSLMRDMELTLQPDRIRGEEPPRGHVTVPEPNRRWATDLTTVWTKRDGVVAVIPVIDCGCRSLLALKASKSQESPAILAPVREALERQFGSPAAVPHGLELRCDHGPQYTGADALDLCRAWGLEQTFAPVGRPTGNSVAERVIRTLKEEVIWLRDWDSLEELQAALDAWLFVYNHIRPHQALNHKTPAAQRAEKLGIEIKAVA